MIETHMIENDRSNAPVALVDIGVNLAHARFARDRDQVFTRAASAGVTRTVVSGTSLGTSWEAAALARSRPGALFATAGVHPHDARHATPQTIAALRELCARPEVRAVGECGLD